MWSIKIAAKASPDGIVDAGHQSVDKGASVFFVFKK